MRAISIYLKHPNVLFDDFVRKIRPLLNDKLYLQLRYFFYVGERLNLKNPQSFTEKIQWLKLYNRKSEYTKMVDKYAAKDYVASIIGYQYVIPTIGIWNHPEEIDWNQLPNQFVLKTTHGGGSGGVVICKDKTTFDRQDAINRLMKSMKADIYQSYAEWPYKNVEKRIIAEKYVEPEEGYDELSDYKFYCFNGKPLYCQVIRDRHTCETIDFYDMQWQHQEFVGLNPNLKNGSKIVPKPLKLSTMIEICEKLSNNIPFVRIDLYSIKDKVLFGESTFYPASGFGRFEPKKWNRKLGELIVLPK